MADARDSSKVVPVGRYLVDPALSVGSPQAKYPNLLSRARGQGTFCAIDVCKASVRDKLILQARDNGIPFYSVIIFALVFTSIDFENVFNTFRLIII